MSKKIYFLCVIILLIVMVMLFAKFLMPYDYDTIDLMNKFAPISYQHLLGTDHLGRDVFSRLLYGTRISLGTTFIIIFFILLIGVCVGGISGFLGGKIDFVLMRLCDIFLSFPTIVMSLFFIAILGAGLTNVIIAITITHWPWYARVIRSIVLNIKTKEYVLISTISGASFLQNFKQNIFIPIFTQCVVLATLDIGHIMMHISGLSFLGVGVTPPIPEWGVMMSDGKDYIWSHVDLVFWPGLAIFICVASFNLLGDFLRDKFDVSIDME